MQLPLRWLLCLNVAFVLLLIMALRRWILRALACVVVLAVWCGSGIGFSLRGGTRLPTLRNYRAISNLTRAADR